MLEHQQKPEKFKSTGIVSVAGSIFKLCVVEFFSLWSPRSPETLKTIASKSSFHSFCLHEQLSIKL